MLFEGTYTAGSFAYASRGAAYQRLHVLLREVSLVLKVTEAFPLMLGQAQWMGRIKSKNPWRMTLPSPTRLFGAADGAVSGSTSMIDSRWRTKETRT
jgi:hypothetical protein